MSHTNARGLKVIKVSCSATEKQKIQDISSKIGTVNEPHQECTLNEIQAERLQHLIHLRKRNKAFKDILNNKNSESISWKYIGYWVMSIFMPLFSTCVWTLIPVHNLFEQPRFWFEYPLQMTVSLIPLFAAYVSLNCSHWMNIDYIKKSRNFFYLWIVGSFIVIIVHFTGYNIWTHLLHYHYPIPLNAYIYNYVLFTGVYGVVWYCFPTHWRVNKDFRNRLKWFIVAMAFNQCISLEYTVITKIFLTIPVKYQFLIALCLPLVREMNCWMNTKLALKASNGDISSVNITCTQNIGAGHSLFLAYTAASILTTTTSAIIFGTDFLINLYIAGKIIWLKRYKKVQVNTEIELLQELVINEMVEFIIPLAYLLCFLTAYYGPNCTLFGNVCNSYWHYTAVDGISKTLETIGIFFAIDCLSGLSCYWLLKTFVNVNIFKALSCLQEEFGRVFTVNMVCTLNAVSTMGMVKAAVKLLEIYL